MKVFFFITSSDRSAKGGHFRSCLTIAESLRDDMEVEIINIGSFKSPVFEQSAVPVRFYPVNWSNWISQTRRIARYVRSAGEARMLSFDFFSFFVARTVSRLTRVPGAFIRCGGRNPSYSPQSPAIFCFSRENYDFYRRLHPRLPIYLVPNRVAPARLAAPDGSLRRRVGNDAPIILRIGRFVPNYELVNRSTLALSRFLTHEGVAHNLVFIGYPDDPGARLYAELHEAAATHANIFVLETPDFTENAARFIGEAQLIIGTGRGAMEAFMTGVPVAVFAKNSELPVLLSGEAVLEDAFAANFSQRAVIGTFDAERNKNELLDFFTRPGFAEQVVRFQKEQERQFNVEYVRPVYREALAALTYRRQSASDWLRHLWKVFLPKLYYIARKTA